MRLSNIEMDAMIAALDPLLDRTDIVGYAAARNTRLLAEAASEYLQRKEALIREYGAEEVGPEGPTGRWGVSADDPRFEEFKSKLAEWAPIEHDAEVYTIPRAEAEACGLTYRELAGAIWMVGD